MELIALNPHELQSAHGEMIAWCESQIALLSTKVTHQKAEAEASQKIIKEQKWANKSDQHLKLYQRGLIFYCKLLVALKEGYVLVPNFAMNVFAVRTTKKSPSGPLEYKGSLSHQQQPEIHIEPGKGEYRSPDPELADQEEPYKNAKGESCTRTLYWPYGWKSVMFPVALAKPRIMAPAARAMALKVFDEIGVAVDTESWRGTKADPIILGRIRNPLKATSAVTFFIAWQFDTAAITPKEK